MGAQVPAKVMEFLAHKITSNVRELEGALNRIVAHLTLVARPITLETTQEVLHDLLRANDRRVTIEEIQKRVAEHFNIRVSDMHSARRARAVARPRQVAMYLAKQLTARSLPEIGRKFGGRDHTTVMHAVRKVDELRATDSSFSDDVRAAPPHARGINRQNVFERSGEDRAPARKRLRTQYGYAILPLRARVPVGRRRAGPRAILRRRLLIAS